MTLSSTVNAFHAVAKTVYREDPFWLGEDPDSMMALIGNARAEDPEAVWLGCIDGEARLAAFMPEDRTVEGKKTAFFGFWEGVDSLESHRKLFTEAEQWALSRGAQVMIGPINVSTFYAYRVRLNQFDAGAFPGEPYNPFYYPDLMESLGYSVGKKFHSWLGPMEGRADAMATVLDPVYQQLQQAGLTFKPMDGDTWLSRLDEFYDYVDQIFGSNFAYTGVSRSAFESGFGKPIANRLCPHSSVLVEHRGGEVAGFFLGFPDYGPLLRRNGQHALNPTDVTYADLDRIQGRKTLLGKTGGVHPDYRKNGLFGVMSYRMMRAGTDRFDWGGAVMVREDNPSAKVGKLAYSRPSDQQRDYALFSKAL